MLKSCHIHCPSSIHLRPPPDRCSSIFYPPKFLSSRIEYSIPPLIKYPGIFYPPRARARATLVGGDIKFPDPGYYILRIYYPPPTPTPPPRIEYTICRGGREIKYSVIYIHWKSLFNLDKRRAQFQRKVIQKRDQDFHSHHAKRNPVRKSGVLAALVPTRGVLLTNNTYSHVAYASRYEKWYGVPRTFYAAPDSPPKRGNFSQVQVPRATLI